MSRSLIVLVAVALLLSSGNFAIATESAEPKSAPESMPKMWDQHIPMPKGAVLMSQQEPKGRGVVHSATFSVDGDYEQLIQFYESGLKQNGFQLGSPVKVPARKAYSVCFTKPGIQDNLVIFPSKDDPSKFKVRVVYDPGPDKVKHPHLARLRDWWALWPHWWRDDSHIWKNGKDWMRREREAAAMRLHLHHPGAAEPSNAPTPASG